MSYFEAIRLTLIKHSMFDKLGAKIWIMDETGIVLFNHKPMKVLTTSGAKSLHSRSSRIKKVTTVIAAVNVDGGKSLTYIVQILLDVVLMHILINDLHILLDM